MKNIAVFGSTGSIGVQTLSVCAHSPERFNVYAIVFGSNAEMGIEQIKRYSPAVVGVFDENAASFVSEACSDVKIVSGSGVWAIAALPEVDIVVNGVSGFNGLFPLLSALEAGKTVALANKESVVCAGDLVRAALKKGGGRILPVDSEQSAIFQCLAAGLREDVSSLILTASGGAFRNFTVNELALVTPEMAMKHPTWNMGRKITIDSSTLFNKGLEVMEAAFLFDMDVDSIRVMIHPQSIVHSMVEYNDGSVIAQLSVPDMRLAIQYAMTYPERLNCPVNKLDLASAAALTFEEPDVNRFPAVKLAYEAYRRGGAMPVAYNSANEVAVDRFIKGDIGFLDIADCVSYAMNRMPDCSLTDMQTLLSLDSEARRLAAEFGGVN